MKGGEKRINTKGAKNTRKNKNSRERMRWIPSQGFQAYAAAIERIKGHIALGDTYQVNYTLRLRMGFDGSAAGAVRGGWRAGSRQGATPP